jgi:lipoprotein-anchoring transpeptidase ErfK/SrfK
VATGFPFSDGVPVTVARRVPAGAGLVALLLAFAVALVPARAVAQESVAPQTVFVPRTGHTADGLFLQVWRAQRALLGDPITEEFRAKTGLGADPDAEQVVQYFENAALVYLPEEAAGNQVRTLPLGREALAEALAERPVPALVGAARRTACGTGGGSGCVGFRETGHTVHPVFQDLWNDGDGERWLGLPVSEAYRAADGSWIQYFEGVALRATGGEVAPLPIGTATAKRLDLETGRVVRPSAVPLFASTLFAAQPAAPAAPEVGAAPAAEAGTDRGVAAPTVPEVAPPLETEVASAPEEVLEPEPEPIVEPQPEPAPEPVAEPAPPEVAPEAAPVVGPGPQQGAFQEVVVSISAQQLWAYEGNELVNSTYVSTGTAEVPETTTPIGSHSVLSKVDVQDMEGTISGEHYFVPDVPYVMYFDNLGNALHGTYWHSNFGAPMSHGCINLPMEVAAWLYGWASVGTAVTVIP